MPRHVDDIFRSALENHHEVADASVWDKLSQTLSSKEGKVVLPWYYNPKKALLVALCLSMFSFGGGYLYALLNDTGNALAADQTESLAEIVVPSTTPVTDNNKENEGSDMVLAYEDAVKQEQVGVSAIPAEIEPSDEGGTVSIASFDNNASPSSQNDEVSTLLVSIPRTSREREVSRSVENEGGEEETVLLDGVSPNMLDGILGGFDKAASTTIEAPIAYGKLASRFVELSYGGTQLNSSYTMDDESVDYYRSEHTIGSNSNYSLRFGKYIHPNVGVFTGMRLDRFSFSRNREQGLVFKPRPNSGTGETFGVVVRSSYDYEFTSFEIPVGVRLKGLYHRLGYHADLGISYSRGLKQSFSYSLPDDYSNLNPDISDSEYDMSGAAAAFSRIGLDYYLFANGGLSVDAVLRKRLIAASGLSQLNGQNGLVGGQVGIFFNF